MAIRNVPYFFGRLNLIAFFEDKYEYVLKGFQGGKIIQIRGSGWGFFETEELEDSSGRWIYGYLVKYKPETEEEKVVLETQQIEDEAVKDRVVAKSRFFIHVESGIIAYHPISNKISRMQFAENFVEVFKANHDKFFVNSELLSIEEEYEILETLRRFTKIQEVNVYLHPSNPSNRDMWERTDQRIKALNAASYQEKIEAKPNSSGLNILSDEETTGKIAMAVDGYGKALVTGILDGETKTISTDDNPISTQAPNDEASVNDIFQTILLTFHAIKSRFQNGNGKSDGKKSERTTQEQQSKTETQIIRLDEDDSDKQEPQDKH